LGAAELAVPDSGQGEESTNSCGIMLETSRDLRFRSDTRLRLA